MAKITPNNLESPPQPESAIDIGVENKVRLFSALLAASNWPQIEQQQKPHAVHPHTKQTMQWVSQHRDHPAVQHINHALAKGIQLADLLTAVLTPSTSEWHQGVDEFRQVTELDNKFWPQVDPIWQTAVVECAEIFKACPLPDLMQKLGARYLPIKIMPSLSFPMLNPVVSRTTHFRFLLLPPPKAWGESPPWPYKEDPIWVVVEAGRALLDSGLAPVLVEMTPENRDKIVQAAVAVCLGQMFDSFEQQAFVVRIKKEMKMADLAQVTTRVETWLAKERLPNQSPPYETFINTG